MTDHDDHTGDHQGDHQDDWPEVHALSGAYAVDALDDIERARFEEHLRRCPACRVEVASLRETAAALAVDPVEPPAGLRADVLAGIEAIRPLPPLTSAESARVSKSRLGVSQRPGRRSAPLLVAAALVVVALAATAWLRPWSEDDTDLSATERVLQADDATSYDQRLPGGGTATIVVSRSRGAAVVQTDDLALAPDGKVYELWLQAPDGEFAPAGLMPDETDVTKLLDGDAGDATGVGITVEPDGGSTQPTTDPFVFFDLTS